MLSQPCGCAYEIHQPTGAMQRMRRCASHQKAFRAPGGLNEDYYRELALLDSQGVLAHTQHVAEMIDALGPFPKAGANPRCLEIGCGVSPYVGALRMAGWHYVGLDASAWALRWNATYWGAHSITADWESHQSAWTFGLIVAAHSLEHMVNAPFAVERMAQHLDPGGRLIILVPDDKDPCNPDHNWLFNDQSIAKTAQRAGFEVNTIQRKSIVPREDFLYLLGTKR